MALRGVRVGSKFVGSSTKGIECSRHVSRRHFLGKARRGRQTVIEPVDTRYPIFFDVCSGKVSRLTVSPFVVTEPELELDSVKHDPLPETPYNPWHSGRFAMPGIPASPEPRAPIHRRQMVVSMLSSWWWPIRRVSTLKSRHAVPRAWKRSLRATVSKAVGLAVSELGHSSSRILVFTPFAISQLVYRLKIRMHTHLRKP